MNKTDYNRFRLLDWIKERKQITRGNVTREGLGRLKVDMAELNSYLGWAELNDYVIVTTEHIPGKRGKPPEVYTVTPMGNQWLKEMRKQAKREREGLK
jgi:DNA-binding PadR family transcriptional regulator